MNERILVVDDDKAVNSLIADVLRDEGYNAIVAEDESAFIAKIEEKNPDLVLLDLWIGDDENAGIRILNKMRKIHPDIPVVIISGHGTIDIAVQAIRDGAFDFLEKPFVTERLLITCANALEIRRLQQSNNALRNFKQDTNVLFVGHSSFAQSMRSLVEKISTSNGRVLIRAQSGLGCEAFAYLIHKKSKRSQYPFVYVNCKSDDPEAFQQTFWGTEKSYGDLERANFGTLYLEDITYLSKECQRRLLQFLAEGRYCLKERNVYADVRLICSTSKPIEQLVGSDEFNRELFFRLNIVSVIVPSLKDRREDIIPLLEYYLEHATDFFGIQALSFNEEAKALFQTYDWPGNIHQLKNMVESALINAAGNDIVDRDALPPDLVNRACATYDSLQISKLISLPIKEAKELFESDYLRAQISRFGGNISRTAEFIGMERSALHRKLRALNLRSTKEGEGA